MNLNKWIYLALISMSPIVECRGSIPYGLLAGLPVVGVFIVAFLSNTLMGIVVYEGVKLLKSWLLKYPKLRNYYENYVRNALKRFKQYEMGVAVSLAIFVGIPLPGTGAFTGAVVAEALEVKRPLAWASLAAGVLIACTVVTLITWSAMQIAR